MKINFDAIYDVVVQIPRGRVATYGQIAELAGISRQARRVGYALSALPKNSGVPWHRVINAKGENQHPFRVEVRIPFSDACSSRKELLLIAPGVFRWTVFVGSPDSVSLAERGIKVIRF